MSVLDRIRWCTTHSSREGEEGLCLWILMENRIDSFSVEDCAFVNADVVEVFE